MADKRKELIEQISCPVAWSSVCSEPEFADVLRYYWFKTVQRHQWYRESDLLRTEDWQPNIWYIEEIYGPVEVDSALENIKKWREAALTEYLSYCSRFAKLRAASEQDYGKHYCRGALSDDEVGDLSKARGESILYPRIDVGFQERVSWAALLEVWFTREEAYVLDIGDLWNTETVVDAFKRAFEPHSLRVAMKVGVPVGCTAGSPSHWLLLDYNFSTPIFHAYPVSPQEAELEAYRFHAKF